MSEVAAPDSGLSSGPANALSLRDLTFFFLRLGVTAFGGPAGHIAMMEQELVTRRNWLPREKFLDLLAASNLIPGPSSSELAIHIGYLLGSWPGLLIAGCCFILPAAVMVGAIAWAYVLFGTLPAVSQILYGIKPVVIAIVLQALWNLSRTAVKTKFLAIIGILSAVLAVLGLQPILVLLLAGTFVAFYDLLARGRKFHIAPFISSRFVTGFPNSLRMATASALAAATPFSLTALFLVFLKTGAVVFGSGYVLLAFLRTDLVAQRHWLTDSQLVDAVAIGQLTPGPVFTTATFIGYLLHGASGALVATIAIFLPAFLLVAMSGPLVPHIRQSRSAGAFLDGVVVASLALMGVVAFQLARASLIDALTVSLAAVSLFLLLRFRMNSAWLILLGALTGLIARSFFQP
jgi:chromate transporter